MIKYEASKHAFHTEGDSLTEQEHIPSCDINIMMKNINRGMHVRGGRADQYGYDDTTMDGLQYQIMKQNSHEALNQLPKELDEETFNVLPPEIHKKYGLSKKQAQNPKTPPNDDQTTITPNPPSPTDPPKKTEPTQS